MKTVTEEWAERAIERLQEGAGENSDEIETEDERQVCLCLGEKERHMRVK